MILRNIAIILAAILLVGCNYDPNLNPLTPFQCRVTGVNVQDDDEVTGIIQSEVWFSTQAEIKAACQKPFHKDDVWGCAIAISSHDGYGVYQTIQIRQAFPTNGPEYNKPQFHERCHAWYEEGEHM
jgi:hypothetical protein